MKFRHNFRRNYGSELLNNAYEKFFKGEHITYEEFVVMLSTNDELYFMYNEKGYQIEYYDKSTYMCVSRCENNKFIIERTEQFNSLIELLSNFKIDGKSIHEIWSDIQFTKSR